MLIHTCMWHIPDPLIVLPLESSNPETAAQVAYPVHLGCSRLRTWNERMSEQIFFFSRCRGTRRFATHQYIFIYCCMLSTVDHFCILLTSNYQLLLSISYFSRVSYPSLTWKTMKSPAARSSGPSFLHQRRGRKNGGPIECVNPSKSSQPL